MEYKGIGVSNGRSLGVAVVIHETEIVNTSTKEINKEEELRKALSAISSLINEYDDIIEDKTKNKEVILLAEAYKMMVSSSSLYDEISDLIIKGNYNAVRAGDEVLTSKAYKMANLDN